ncbi:MAG: glycosyltransferase family 4 protein [Thermodesulfobacteriota bacterium]|nr:glycosyltransferase family 4 protein [Thermodesulfobacteriota bacterium]
MRLAVFSGQYFWFDGSGFSTDEAFVRFVTSFHPYFERIIFCDALKQERKRAVYELDPREAEVCPLPNYNVHSIWKGLLIDFPEVYRVVKDNIGQWDVVWLHAPHPVSLIFAWICRRLDKPYFLFIRQNLPVYVRYRSVGARRLLALSVAHVLDFVFRVMARHTLSFVVGREILNRYGNGERRVFQTFISLVSEKDIPGGLSKQMQRTLKQTKLLYVGRLAPEKGLICLLRAMGELLGRKNVEVSLLIVGEGPEEERLRGDACQLGLDEHVSFLGYVEHGCRLFDLYRQSDVYILPSLTEGWPQTLFEAMACAVPVVATRVGGIPHLIEDGYNGLLVSPGSPGEICRAVERLAGDLGLRNRIVRNGISTVEKHSMESERDRVVKRIEEVLGMSFGERTPAEPVSGG